MSLRPQHIITVLLCVMLYQASEIVCASTVKNTMPGSFDERIRSMQVTLNDNQFAPPVLTIGTNDVLTFSFDHIADDRSYFRYRLIHCNANWQPSDLVDSEIINGFNEGIIDNFAFSRGTTVNYVNYVFSLPNDNMTPLVSGNYLVVIYEESKPDEILGQWRIMVNEQTARIGLDLSSRTDIDYNVAHQQLTVTVDTERDNVSDPFNDLTVMIQQNGRLDNETSLKHPMRMSGRKAIYEHQPQLIFDAGNEYRRFESVSNNFPGMHVDSLRYMGSNYHVWLKPDASRASAQYSFDRTQHGRFMVHEYNATDSSIGADYITVHFLLDMPEIMDSEVYVDGEFTHGLYNDYNRMTYDRAKGVYTAEIPVKQGAYNYQYVVKRRMSTDTPVPAPIEGNKFETGNEYGVAIYFRPPGARADRLVSFTTLTSN